VSEASPHTPDSPSQDEGSEKSFGEQSLDEHIEQEAAEAAELDEAEDDGQSDEGSDEEEPSDSEEEEESADYEPTGKYKVLDEEHEFDPKLKKLLTKETEPIIRELYEKAHGIEAIKSSRAQVTKERDEVRGNYNNMLGEVGRVMNYKRSGDLQSFFESVQLDDQTIAKYILEKVRISQLPPEQQAVYNEREALRKRMNHLEQNFQQVQTTGQNAEVQARMTELDSVLSSGTSSQIAKAFDARNGKGAFKQAVVEHGAQKWYATQKDLSPSEAVESFIKMTGLSVPKGQPKPGANVTKRVVARPKVKTIPSYGGGQASVTATRKPKSVEDLKRIAKEKFG
jgi:hypothetical protein